MARFEAVKDAFVEFVENVPFYGAALLCIDHPEVQAIIPRAARPARRHLRLRRPGRRARRQCHAAPGRQPLRRRCSATATARSRTITGHRAADAGPAQCPERARRDRRGGGDGHRRRGRSSAASPASAASSGASPGSARSTAAIDDRRLRPSSGRDPRGAVGGARGRRGAGDRGRAAASLHPARAT